MNKITKTNIEIELLRVIACLLVISNHILNNYAVQDNIVSYKVLFLSSFTRVAVPIFFMITGYFLFRSKKSYKHMIIDLIKKIIFPAFVVMILSQILNDWFSNQRSFIECFKNIIVDNKDLFGNLFTWNAGMKHSAHLWYIFAYVQIFIWYPLLKMVCVDNDKAKKIRLYLIVICIFTYCLLPDILKIFPFKYGNIIFKSPIDASIMYIIMGYEFSLINKDRFTLKNVYKCLGVYLLGVLLTFLIVCIDIMKYGGSGEFFLHSNNTSCVIAAVGIFNAITFLTIKKPEIRNTIKFISTRTFCIYLVHWSVMIVLFSKGYASIIRNNLRAFAYPVLIFLCFILSLIIAIIVNEISKIIKSIVNNIVKNSVIEK